MQYNNWQWGKKWSKEHILLIIREWTALRSNEEKVGRFQEMN